MTLSCALSFVGCKSVAPPWPFATLEEKKREKKESFASSSQNTNFFSDFVVSNSIEGAQVVFIPAAFTVFQHAVLLAAAEWGLLAAGRFTGKHSTASQWDAETSHTSIYSNLLSS